MKIDDLRFKEKSKKDKRIKDKITGVAYERLKCPHCGTKNFLSPEKQVFCSSCGSELNYETLMKDSAKSRKKTTILVLVIIVVIVIILFPILYPIIERILLFALYIIIVITIIIISLSLFLSGYKG